MTDWYTQLSQPEEQAPAAPPGQDWYGQMAPQPAQEDRSYMDAPYSDATGAGAGTIAAGSLISDPAARVRYFAQQRGIAPERYRLANGIPVYQDDQGNWHREIPRDMIPGSFTEAGRSAASALGPLIPQITGGVTGVVTSPMLMAGPAGMAGSMALTGAAQAGGQALREGLAGVIAGQEFSPSRVAVAGAEGALGQGIGAGLAAWGNRALVNDLARAQDPVRAAENIRAQAAAQRAGISLTPAETLGLSSLRAQQKYLNNTAASQDIMEDFYRRRTQQVADATESFLGGLSTLGREEAGQMGAQAGAAAMDRVAAERAARASPIYRQAFESGDTVQIGPVVRWLDDQISRARGPIRQSLEQARSYLQADGIQVGETRLNVIDDTLPGLHQAKLAIDALIQGRDPGRGSVDNVSRGLLTQLQQRLLGAMDGAGEGGRLYGQARGIFADAVPGVQVVREGVAGQLADLGQREYFAAAQNVFRNGPREISRVREQLTALTPERDGVDGTAAWNGIMRGYLEDVFDQSSREFASQYGRPGNVAGRIGATFSDPRTLDKLRAAMDPQQFRAFDDLMLAMRRAGSVQPVGSDTEFNRLITEAERNASRTFIGRVARNVNPAEALRNFDNWLTDRNMSNRAATIAQIITSPDAMRQLRTINALPPGSVQSRVLMGHLLSAGGFGAARDLTAPSGDVSTP